MRYHRTFVIQASHFNDSETYAEVAWEKKP